MGGKLRGAVSFPVFLLDLPRATCFVCVCVSVCRWHLGAFVVWTDIPMVVARREGGVELKYGLLAACIFALYANADG